MTSVGVLCYVVATSVAVADQAERLLDGDELSTDMVAASTSATVHQQEVDDNSERTPSQPRVLPQVVVVESRLTGLEEELPVGSYGQPSWTAQRRFPTTRVYIIPQGEKAIEYWFRAETPRHGETQFEHREEIELGLPYRFQLDLYLIERHLGGKNLLFDQSIEGRWAFADWGRLPGNPAAYAEYIRRQEDPDKIELKLLLGDAIAPRWHWGTNWVWERELSGERVQELELTGGLSYTLIDGRLSAGTELKAGMENQAGSRGHWVENIRLGPSLQIRPALAWHIDVAPLFGVTHDSDQSDVFLVVGCEF